MSFDFNSDTPIYLQLIDLIKMQIIRKEYRPLDKLPSVRELSLKYSVNPNTIQKALGELENMGLIVTERTNGKFVTGDENLIREVSNQTVKEMVHDFYNSMSSLGLEKSEILKILEGEQIWIF